MNGELTGAELDLAVAEAEGYAVTPYPDGSGAFHVRHENGMVLASIGRDSALNRYSPSTNWAQGGPLIAEHGIELVIIDSDHMVWEGLIRLDFSGTGPTPLIAACRAIVASEEKNHE